MTSRTPPDWHMQARKLHAEGMSSGAIAKLLGRNHSTVSWVLDVNGERKRTTERQRRFRAAKEAMKANAAAPAPTETRTMSLCRLFAAGQIDRPELMRRLRGGQA